MDSVFGVFFMKIGRNDPCICSSGKKYKKCCLPKAQELAAQQIKIGTERNLFRSAICEYFEKNFEKEVEKYIFDPLINKVKSPEYAGVVDGMFMGDISIYWKSFLGTPLSEDTNLTYFDYICREFLVESTFSFSDILAFRKMEYESYIGYLEILRLGCRSILVRNIVTNQKIELFFSGNGQFDLNEDYLGQIMIQVVEPYKGVNFTCGNAHVVCKDMEEKLILELYKDLPKFIKLYYSSYENRTAFREQNQKNKELQLEYFNNAYPITSHNRKAFCKTVTHFLDAKEVIQMKAGTVRSFVEKMIPYATDVKRHGISFAMNSQGFYFFSDYPYLKGCIGNYITFRSEECFLDDFLMFIEEYMKSDNIPMDIFLDLNRDHPQEIEYLLADYNKYFGYQFKDWLSIIKYWRPDFDNPIPLNLEIDKRISALIKK